MFIERIGDDSDKTLSMATRGPSSDQRESETRSAASLGIAVSLEVRIEVSQLVQLSFAANRFFVDSSMNAASSAA